MCAHVRHGVGVLESGGGKLFFQKRFLLLHLELVSDLFYLFEWLLLKEVPYEVVLKIVWFDCLGIKATGGGEHGVYSLVVLCDRGRCKTTRVRSGIRPWWKRGQLFRLVARNQLVVVLFMNCIRFQSSVKWVVNLLHLGLDLHSWVHFHARTLNKSTLMSHLLLSLRDDEVWLRQEVDDLLFSLHFDLVPDLRRNQHTLIDRLATFIIWLAEWLSNPVQLWMEARNAFALALAQELISRSRQQCSRKPCCGTDTIDGA